NPSGDAYSVLLLKDSPTWLVGVASQDGRKVIKEIESAKPSHGNASVTTAFSMIAAKLGEGKGRYQKNQAGASLPGMRRSTWLAAARRISALRPDDTPGKERQAYAQIEATAKAGTFFIACGPAKEAPNLAVTAVEFDLNETPYVTAGIDL